MRNQLFSCAVAIVILLAAADTQGTVINVDLNSGINPSNTQLNQGAFSTPDAHIWNAVVLGSGIESATLLASDGTATAVTLTVSFNGTYDINSQGGPQSSMIDARPLLNDFIYNTSGNPLAFTIDHLAPNTEHDLYLYAAPGGAGPRATTFTINSTSLTATGTDLTTLSEGVNYVRFAAVQSDSSGRISGTFAAGPSSGEGDFNGLQIVLAPEPGFFALLVPGALFLLQRRQRSSSR